MIPTPTNGEISFYFHIPFCTKKCDYCHFFVLPNNPKQHELFLKALKKEWDFRFPSWQNKEIKSIYFGGGTPALLLPEEIATILSWIPYSKDIEITLEANPENITLPLLRGFKEAGINRLSIGIQAFDDDLLKILGRMHSSKTAYESVLLAKTAGFDNISIDLMYDLPFQSLKQWENTLKKSQELPLTHLSLYNLTFEKEALFYKKQKQLTPHLPDPETSLKMYLMAQEELSKIGLNPYEISAFAKNNQFSIHNAGYWTGRPFLGFGPSAFSFFQNDRFKNVSHLNKYLKALDENTDPADFHDILSIEDRRKELLAVELRLRRGVHLPTFEMRHGPLSHETLKTIQQLIQKDWMIKNNETIYLTMNGILFYDSASSELI